MDDSTNQTENEPTESKAGRFAVKALTLFGILIAGVFGKVIAKSIFSDSGSSHQTQEAIRGAEPESEWQRFQLGTSRYSILSPRPLQTAPIDLPESLQSLVREMDSYKLELDNPIFLVGAARYVYADGIDLNLAGAAEGVATQFRQLDGVQNLDYSTHETTVSGTRGVSFDGTMERYGTRLSFKGIAVGETPEMVTVFAMSKISDPVSSAWVVKSIESLSIN